MAVTVDREVPLDTFHSSSSSEDTTRNFFMGFDDSLTEQEVETTGTSSGSNSREVAFSTVYVREHALEFFHSSSSSSCLDAPLRLGWEQGREFECTVEDYENRSGGRSGPKKLVLEDRRARLGLPAPPPERRYSKRTRREEPLVDSCSLSSSPIANETSSGQTPTRQSSSATDRRARFIASTRAASFHSREGLLPEYHGNDKVKMMVRNRRMQLRNLWFQTKNGVQGEKLRPPL